MARNCWPKPFTAPAEKNSPFIRINCAAIPESLLESELFGYEEGSFAGARKGGKPGKFELAHRGTLFLDEIGDMSPAVQTKLFRAIQEKEVERIGRTRSIRTDVRIIAATNQDLEKGVVEKNNSASFLFFSHTPVWNNNTFFSGSSQK